MKEFGKNLMIRKKGIPLDEKETFCNIIDLLEEKARLLLNFSHADEVVVQGNE